MNRFPGVDQLRPIPGLPDPLVMLNGDRVTTKANWFEKRRPELKALFQHYMYGVPPAAPKISARIERDDARCLGGKATKREIAISFGPIGTPVLHLLLIVPNQRRARVPVFVGANFCGNHTVLNDPTIALPQWWVRETCLGVVNNRATDAGRGKAVDTWNAELVIDGGYALATFYYGDVDPDCNRFDDGIHPHFLKPGEKRNNQSWGAISAWAFGISRAVDYLVTDEAIDKAKIISVGHSRLGKTALLAAAYDERIAMSIPLQSGSGGAAPSRTKIGETIKQTNDVFPHWLCDEFKKFNNRPELIPFDQHSLIALVAPRPVLLANAEDDEWANPAGQFEILKAADPVYRLLGAGGLDAYKMPANSELVSSTLGYFMRAGKHSMARVDWAAFLDFADRHFGKPQ
jgi:hypothetical protein